MNITHSAATGRWRVAAWWLALSVSLAALSVTAPSSAYAEEDPPTSGAGEPPPQPSVGVIQGSRVNLRVGPRPGGRPVAQLDDGTVLLIVKRLGEWLAVQVPSGFMAAVSGKYVKPVGTDGVRVEANRLNLRVEPPQEGRPMPGAFQDRVVRGTVLPLIEREGEWLWVMAPESTTVYVSAKYVRELGPQTEHAAVVKAARARRTAQLETLARIRREKIARISGAKLRDAIGTAQQRLYKLRLARGIERTPVVETITALEAAIEECRESPVGARKLARAVREDLEAELEIRMARKDAEVARLRGLDPPAEKAIEKRIEQVQVRGVIQWEAAPKWRNGGEWVLWVDEEPRFVLQLTTGLPHPLPNFKANAADGTRAITASQPGTRVFGLPVLYVRSIKK